MGNKDRQRKKARDNPGCKPSESVIYGNVCSNPADLVCIIVCCNDTATVIQLCTYAETLDWQKSNGVFGPGRNMM